MTCVMRHRTGAPEKKLLRKKSQNGCPTGFSIDLSAWHTQLNLPCCCTAAKNATAPDFMVYGRQHSIGKHKVTTQRTASQEVFPEAITMRFVICPLQITIELRAEELLKQDCAKPLQCVLHSSTCKSQCNYVIQLPKHISQNRISTPRQKKSRFSIDF